MLELGLKEKQGQWIKVKEGICKKVKNPKGINVKNRFSILDWMDEKSNIFRYREDGANYMVLRDSQVRDLGIEVLNIRKFRIRKRVVMCYPRVDTDFIED